MAVMMPAVDTAPCCTIPEYLYGKKMSPAAAEDELNALARGFIREVDISLELLVTLVERIEFNSQKNSVCFSIIKAFTVLTFLQLFNTSHQIGGHT